MLTKRFLSLHLLIPCLCVLAFQAFAQTKIAIQGTIKSTQGVVVQDATVSFFNAQQQPLGTCISESDGHFKSEKLFKADQTVTIKVTVPGFSDKSLTHKVKSQNGASNAGEIALQPKTIIIGFVTDSVTLEPVQGAEVSFFDKNNQLIQSRSTNSKGYFDFETDFTYGEIIRVRVSKLYYFPREKTLRIVKPDRDENRVDILLPKIEDTGIKVTLRVFDRTTNKPLGGAKVRYPMRGANKDTVTATSGEVLLNIFQQPGTRLNLRIQKSKFKEIIANPALAMDSNTFDYWMEREYHFPLCKCLYGGSAGLAILGTTTYFLSKKAYKNYKSFDNTEPLNDYHKANTLLRTSVISGGVAVLLLGSGLLCNHLDKKKESGPPRTGAVLPQGYIDPFGNVQIGITYHFNQ